MQDTLSQEKVRLKALLCMSSWVFVFTEKQQEQLEQQQKEQQQQLHDQNNFSSNQGAITASGAPNLVKLESMGVTHIICLLRSDEPQFGKVVKNCEQCQVKLTHIPLTGGKLEGTNDITNMHRLKEALPLLKNGEKVLVHCAAGMHRTGVCCFIIMRLIGYSFEDALHAVKMMRPITYEQLTLPRKKDKGASLVDKAEIVVRDILESS